MKIPQFVSGSRLGSGQIKNELLAGLMVTAIAIPQSLGFAAIVGLPVQTGLYCALIAPLVFALLTSSRHLVVGADSATAALVASGAASVATLGTSEYVNAVAILGIITGLLLIVMSAARFGFLADLISRPVFVGFLAGIGIQLMVGRLPDILGISFRGTPIDILTMLTQSAQRIHLPTLALSIVTFLLIIILNHRKLPGSLLALVSAIAVTYFADLPAMGIAVIGNVPAGLPAVVLPSFDSKNLLILLPTALALALIILVQSSTLIRNTAAKYDEPVDDNRDLTALGFANIVSSLTQGFTINGSPARTTASELAGGRTQWVNVIMSVSIAILLLSFSPSLHYLPIASLAVIVFMIGARLLDLAQLRRIFNSRRAEFVVAFIALAGVAIFGVQYGVAIAVGMSIIERMRRQYRPQDEILLRDRKLAEWANTRLGKDHKHRSSPPGVLVYRFGGSIFFENANYFMKRILAAIDSAHDPVRYVILDAGSINDIDFTASEALKRLCHKLNTDDIQFGLAHVSPELRSLLVSHDLIDIIGKNNIYPTLEAAIFDLPTSRRSTVDMVKRLDIPQGSYVVIGGGVLEALHLRDTNDVDLVVTDTIYKMFKKRGWKEYIHDDGKRVLSHHGYQLMRTWMGRSFRQLKTNAFKISDVTFMNLDELERCKKQLGRPKDLDDVRLIHKYRAHQGLIKPTKPV